MLNPLFYFSIIFLDPFSLLYWSIVYCSLPKSKSFKFLFFSKTLMFVFRVGFPSYFPSKTSLVIKFCLSCVNSITFSLDLTSLSSGVWPDYLLMRAERVVWLIFEKSCFSLSSFLFYRLILLLLGCRFSLSSDSFSYLDLNYWSRVESSSFIPLLYSLDGTSVLLTVRYFFKFFLEESKLSYLLWEEFMTVIFIWELVWESETSDYFKELEQDFLLILSTTLLYLEHEWLVGVGWGRIKLLTCLL